VVPAAEVRTEVVRETRVVHEPAAAVRPRGDDVPPAVPPRAAREPRHAAVRPVPVPDAVAPPAPAFRDAPPAARRPERPPPAPTVHVRIGRIVVRADAPTAPPAAAEPPARGRRDADDGAPGTDLAAYLAARGRPDARQT
jgi:hypothetical protein